MLNLYAVTVWHSSGPRHFELIEVRAYSAQRAELLANESFPGCIAVAERIADAISDGLAIFSTAHSSTLKSGSCYLTADGGVQGGVRGGSDILPLAPRQKAKQKRARALPRELLQHVMPVVGTARALLLAKLRNLLLIVLLLVLGGVLPQDETAVDRKC